MTVANMEINVRTATVVATRRLIMGAGTRWAGWASADFKRRRCQSPKTNVCNDSKLVGDTRVVIEADASGCVPIVGSDGHP